MVDDRVIHMLRFFHNVSRFNGPFDRSVILENGIVTSYYDVKHYQAIDAHAMTPHMWDLLSLWMCLDSMDVYPTFSLREERVHYSDVAKRKSVTDLRLLRSMTERIYVRQLFDLYKDIYQLQFYLEFYPELNNTVHIESVFLTQGVTEFSNQSVLCNIHGITRIRGCLTTGRVTADKSVIDEFNNVIHKLPKPTDVISKPSNNVVIDLYV